MAYEEIPQWFWDLIDSSKPDLAVLAAKLESLEKQQVEDYFGYYKRASQEIRDPWDGPYIDEEIGNLSEDSTEDLTDWIVSQGFDYWDNVGFEDEELAEVFEKMYAVERDGDTSLAKWHSDNLGDKYNGWHSPKAIAMAIYKKKHGESILEHIDEIMDRVS